MLDPDRLARQLEFILELDRLKGIERRSWLLHSERRENSAEHSWHLAIMAMVLCEHAAEPVDRLKVIEMVLVHDVVEIDAGDTFRYDTAGQVDQAERERRAADRLFALLPPEQGVRMRQLWEEFEARQTPEARFAAALDRLMPMLHNLHGNGRGWRENGVTADRVLATNAMMAEGAPALWEVARAMVQEAVAQGVLPAEPRPDR
ncbi:MAG TPA: HD domain-containing protein [Thermoanaerobaculia bacterium]|nr:HD domain-containing protein [Thermoanaerobaculia bacterium]